MKSKQIIRSPTLRVQVAINAVKTSCDSEPADLCGTMSRVAGRSDAVAAGWSRALFAKLDVGLVRLRTIDGQ